MKKLEKGMDEMISSIYKVIPDAKNNSNVDVRYYEGTHNVFSVYQKSLKADEVFSFVNLDNYFEVYPETSYIWEKALDDNEDRVLYALTVDTEMARGVQKSAHKRYHSKFLKGIAPFGNVDIHIYDNEVAIIKLDKEKPSAIVINSDIVASSLKAIHQLIWGITE